MTLKDLYGKKMLKFVLSLNSKGLSKEFTPVTVNTPKPTVAPCSGCDVIINDESARSERIFTLNPKCIEDLTQATALNGNFSGNMFGYCFEEDRDRVVEIFKSTLEDKVDSFAQKQLTQIQALTDALSLPLPEVKIAKT